MEKCNNCDKIWTNHYFLKSSIITENICKEDPELASHRMKYICVALQVSHLSHNHLGRKPRKKHPFILILGIAQIEEGNLALINFYTFFYFGFPLIFFWIHFVFVPDFCHIFPIFRFKIYEKKILFVEHPSHRFLVKKFLTHLGTDLKTHLHKV